MVGSGAGGSSLPQSLRKASALRFSRRTLPAVAGIPQRMLPVGVGLCVLGTTIYAFLALCARVLGPDRYGALAAMWALVFLVGPGVFFPIEQELSRAVAARKAVGVGSGPLVRRAAVVAVALASSLGFLAAAFAGPLVDDVFDGQPILVVGLVICAFAYAWAHVLRGVLSGNGRFRAYGWCLGAEGVFRLALAVSLVVAGVRTAGPLGLTVALAPLLVTGVVMARQAGLLLPGPAAPWRELCRSLALMLVASLLVQVLIHAGPIAVRLLADEGATDITGRFSAGLYLARVPLFLFLVVQASLLPGLTTSVAEGDGDGFRAAVGRVLALTAATGAATVVGAFVFGRLAIEIVFGADFLLGRWDLALLAASTAFVMVALALGQAMVALERQGWVAASWLAGVATFVASLSNPGDVVLRVELGLLVGAVVAACVMSFGLRTALVEPVAPGGVPAGHHEPVRRRAGPWPARRLG